MKLKATVVHPCRLRSIMPQSQFQRRLARNTSRSTKDLPTSIIVVMAKEEVAVEEVRPMATRAPVTTIVAVNIMAPTETAVGLLEAAIEPRPVAKWMVAADLMEEVVALGMVADVVVVPSTRMTLRGSTTCIRTPRYVPLIFIDTLL